LLWFFFCLIDKKQLFMLRIVAVTAYSGEKEDSMFRVFDELLPIIDKITGTQDALEQLFILPMILIVFCAIVFCVIPVAFCYVVLFWRAHRPFLLRCVKAVLIPCVVAFALPIGAAIGICTTVKKWVKAFWRC